MMYNSSIVNESVKLADEVSVLSQPEPHVPISFQGVLTEKSSFDETRSRSPRDKLSEQSKANLDRVTLEVLFKHSCRLLH